MTIDRETAAEALRSVGEAETRARGLRIYQTASAPLLIWGLIWFAANLSCQFFPDKVATIWLAADAVGLVACGIAVRLAPGNRAVWSRHLLALGSVIIFTVCAAIVTGATGPKRLTALISITIALCYLIIGIFGAGVRFAILGLILMAAIVAGYQLLPDYHYLWLGIVGGGGLCLAALWMRKV
jgi:hypothetical protein